MQSLSTFDPDPLLATMARIFAIQGSAKEVAVLASAHAKFVFQDYEYEKHGPTISEYGLELEVSNAIYAQVAADLDSFRKNILRLSQELLRNDPPEDERLVYVSITTPISNSNNWRDKAKDWLSGDSVTNQGRVRSDNIAPKTCDGLLFRSEPEINLYKAFKAKGISFAPLPVFVRGGETYRRIEPDFVLLKDGIVMIVEVDGDTVHKETPADAHARTTMLVHEGAHVERVRASECETEPLAMTCAEKLLNVLEKLKSSR